MLVIPQKGHGGVTSYFISRYMVALEAGVITSSIIKQLLSLPMFFFLFFSNKSTLDLDPA